MSDLWFSNIEIFVEEECADFRHEMEKYRLERETCSTKSGQSKWLERRMRDFSMWMVSTGKRLSQQYQDPNSVPRSYQSFKLAK